MSKTITVDELGGFLDGVAKNLANPQASKVLSEWNDVLARPFKGVPDQALDTVTEMLSQHLIKRIDAT